MQSRGDISIVEDSAALAEAGARRFVELAQASIEAQGRFSVALSGGRTPRAMQELLAQTPYRERVDWASVYVFWGDERFVPPDDPESTLGMARESLLLHVPIPARNIHPIPTLAATPEEAADSYIQTLIDFFGSETTRFDLIFLGMGPDGHTAALFPNHREVTSPSDRLVAAVRNSPKPPAVRLTFTFKAINSAANVVFMVGGNAKAVALKDVFQGATNPARRPTQGIRPEQGNVLWLLDRAAAQGLERGAFS